MNEMIFMMGLPAAGKSSICAQRFAKTHSVIDPDEIKKTHADYDPKNPNGTHEWSMQMEERAFLAALASAKGQWVIDGTGTNAEKMVRRMNEARAMGFAVKLVYCVVSLATSIKRNAARERNVPEYVIREKALNIATSFQIVAPHADVVEVVNNE